MNINKSIRKQNKSTKRFVLSMSFIFIMLPLLLFASKTFNFFIGAYLIVIEVLIYTSIFILIHKNTLEYECNDKIRIKNGLLKGKYYMDTSEVVFVHCIEKDDDFSILLILKSRMKNKNVKAISSEFFDKYALAKGCKHSLSINDLQKKGRNILWSDS